MAKCKEPGDDRRVGAVKGCSAVKSPITGNWTKRENGTFMDQKEKPSPPFKGVRKDKSAIKRLGDK